jgi:hypothetical protein
LHFFNTRKWPRTSLLSHSIPPKEKCIARSAFNSSKINSLLPNHIFLFICKFKFPFLHFNFNLNFHTNTFQFHNQSSHPLISSDLIN